MSSTGLILVLFAAGLAMGANLLLRAGIDAAGGLALGGSTQIWHTLSALFMQPFFVTGFTLYFVASALWFRVVATEPLSLAYPIFAGLTFALVTAGAVVFFSETLSLHKVVGLAVILAGIAIAAFEKGAA